MKRIGLAWGAGGGVLWSLVPGFLSELLHPPGQAATVVLSGALTGLLLSAGMAPLLVRARRWQVVVLGLVSLPLGAGSFAWFLTWSHLAVLKVTGVHFRGVMEIVEPPGYIFDPIGSFWWMAEMSLHPMPGLICLPLAILTAIGLRRQLTRFAPLH